jgi:TPR repeat protein
VEAFANAGLSQEEIQIFRSAAAAFAKNSVGSGETNALASSVAPPAPKPSREPDGSELALQFQMHRSRASDDSPYLQFLLAKDYLEGLGTEKNEKLGLEWMQRAAGNGSGDARTFLDRRGIPVPREK